LIINANKTHHIDSEEKINHQHQIFLIIFNNGIFNNKDYNHIIKISILQQKLFYCIIIIIRSNI